MPATYTIDQPRRLVFSSGTGIVTGAEMLEHQRRLRDDPAFQPDFSQLADFSEVTELTATADHIRLLAENNPFGAGAKRAFVAPRPVFYGIARMFQILVDEQKNQIEIFLDREAAKNWLGLEG